LRFFWAFFHSSLAPTVEIGSIWPPEGFVTFNPWEVPFLNTANPCLSSGAAITAAHHFILAGDRMYLLLHALEATLGFAVVFTLTTGDGVPRGTILVFQMVFMVQPFLWLLVFMVFMLLLVLL
jgi:hypothetical protein